MLPALNHLAAWTITMRQSSRTHYSERRLNSMALSNAEKQQAHRDRQAKAGLTEVRGIYARPELHDKIKTYAKKLQKITSKP